MIALVRPNGHALIVNADLIETIERNDDGDRSIITLTTGNVLVVCETPERVRDAVLEYRRAIVSGP